LQKGADVIYHHDKFGGDTTSHADSRRKSLMFFVFVFWLPDYLSGKTSVSILDQRSYSTPGPVSAWMGDPSLDG